MIAKTDLDDRHLQQEEKEEEEEEEQQSATEARKSPWAWNSVLRELAKKSHFEDAWPVYLQLLRSGASPDAFTFPFVIKSCAALSLLAHGKQLHCHAIRTGCSLDPYVRSGLISMYGKCKLVEHARRVFDESPRTTKLLVLYNSLMSGYCAGQRVNDAMLLLKEMMETGVEIDGVSILGLVPACGAPERLGLGKCIHGFCVAYGLDKDPSVGNGLLTMYAKSGEMSYARKLFSEISTKGVITWNAMINGCAQNGLAHDVLELYGEMKSSGARPDPITMVGVLTSCAHLGARAMGREVEEDIRSHKLESNAFLKNALINMHARCGNLTKARDVFDGMSEKSLVSWTAMIGGYGMHGEGETATKLFDEMIGSGIMPDGAAFVSVLSACSHAGLTNRGTRYFQEMESRYGLKAGKDHYTCMVDLLGRAGRLVEARQLIACMKIKPDAPLWGALLGACKIHKNVEMAEEAFDHVIKLDHSNIGYYVLLANIYTEEGNMDGLRRVRVMMRDQKLIKEPGCSYVELNGRVHIFFAGDRSHHHHQQQTDDLYARLHQLERLVKKGDDEEEAAVAHSEKLAIAFAVSATERGAKIIVIKNLRICIDCHLFIKLVSEVVGREFVVRDATRFHHFRNGVCSCKDYW